MKAVNVSIILDNMTRFEFWWFMYRRGKNRWQVLRMKNLIKKQRQILRVKKLIKRWRTSRKINNKIKKQKL